MRHQLTLEEPRHECGVMLAVLSVIEGADALMLLLYVQRPQANWR